MEVLGKEFIYIYIYGVRPLSLIMNYPLEVSSGRKRLSMG